MLLSPITIYPISWSDGEKRSPVRIVNSGKLPFRQKGIWLLPHRKDYYLIQYVKQGTGCHWVDMVPYDYRQNSIYFSSPEQVHVKGESTLTGTVISFTKEFFTIEQNSGIDKLPLIQNLMNLHELRLTISQIEEFELILDNCVKEYQQEGALRTEMLYAHLRVLITYLSRIYTDFYNEKKPFQNRDLYRRFQNCLEENYLRIQTAGEYSQLLNISVSHLNALIKSESGKTVTQHVHDRLILEAKRLLYNTDQTIKQIAFSLNFRDTSYFSRFFKKMTSHTPFEYRKQISR